MGARARPDEQAQPQLRFNGAEITFRQFVEYGVSYWTAPYKPHLQGWDFQFI